jgi:hypothetical protein
LHFANMGIALGGILHLQLVLRMASVS